MATKYTKEEVGYSDKGRDNHCSICKHWHGEGKCDIVSGDVKPGGWCEHFKRKGRKAYG